VGISMSCVSADLACSTIRLTPWVGWHGRQELEPVLHHSQSHASAGVVGSGPGLNSQPTYEFALPVQKFTG
jgi:hypothetical protein